ncbi:uncharacterized protein LOC116399330 isoform X2 [Anarrhichthys ocellatus]|uniref:uncharacterized protein LOC116399330 isoform X2 n=1 Tax=Anarrhichthys ocellatus TaxID=433405 RepID=UPI0012ED099C|nr:uncharacterized protein LOC116399330 isoform X2 [Anarrhichthys ocellatus]
MNDLQLWYKDSVHLSDSDGMPILAKAFFSAAHDHLLSKVLDPVSTKKPDVSPKTSPPARRISPKVVVKGEVRRMPRRPGPSEWTFVGCGKKRHHLGKPEQSCGAPKRRLVHQQVVKECSVRLWRFSSAILDAMDAVPSHLPSPAACPAVVSQCRKERRMGRPQKAVLDKTVTEQQVDTPSVANIPVEPSETVAVNAEVPIPQAVQLSSMPTSPSRALQVDMRESDHLKGCTQRNIKGQTGSNPNECICANKRQTAVVAGTVFSKADGQSNVNIGLARSVVAAIKHVITPVCTWKGSEVDGIRVESMKLEMASHQSNVAEEQLCTLLKQSAVFGISWAVDVGEPEYNNCETVLLRKMEELLDGDRMCLLNLDSAVITVIQHGKFFVVVDCGVRDAGSGLASVYGTPVAVFNTCMADLMYHIRDLKESLNAG